MPDPGPHARFPWAPALLCAASLAMAAWTWMRYSYVWNMTIGELRDALPMSGTRWPYGAFVRVRGRIVYEHPLTDGVWLDACIERYPIYNARALAIADARGGCGTAVFVPKQRAGADRGDDCSFTGRLAAHPWTVMELGDRMAIDATSRRLVPQSVASLVVGAMGCFVFGLYLRSWLKSRRAS